MRNHQTITISLFPELLEEAERLAKEENAPAANFFGRPFVGILRRKNGSAYTVTAASKPRSKD